MVKTWSDVSGLCPQIVFNAHTGPSAQMWGLDDFIAADFDSVAHGFIGGATPNIENQQLPTQISREALPPDTQSWGQPYKDHLRECQHICAVRLQPDALPYHANYLDLDPRHRDRSGLGMPVLRITYDMQPNEHRTSDFTETKAEEILRAIGASKIWQGIHLQVRQIDSTRMQLHIQGGKGNTDRYVPRPPRATRRTGDGQHATPGGGAQFVACGPQADVCRTFRSAPHRSGSGASPTESGALRRVSASAPEVER